MANNFSVAQKDDLISKLRTVTTYTELSGVTSSIASFSYAGAKSSYSFGILQFDVKADVKNA